MYEVTQATPIVIYGAGARGRSMAKSLLNAEFHVIAFLDRDAENLPDFYHGSQYIYIYIHWNNC